MDGRSRLLLLLLLAVLIQDAYSEAECYYGLPNATLTTDMNWIASIDRHNFYRAKHQVDPLEFNQELSEIAQNWANTLARRAAFEHSNHPCIGENLATKGSPASFDIDPNFAVDGWYNEIKDYSFQSGTGVPGKMVGHLTQVLWMGSREVGVAYAKYQRNGWTHYVVVANYYPPGNYVGEETKNVFPATDGSDRGLGQGKTASIHTVPRTGMAILTILGTAARMNDILL